MPSACTPLPYTEWQHISQLLLACAIDLSNHWHFAQQGARKHQQSVHLQRWIAQKPFSVCVTRLTIQDSLSYCLSSQMLKRQRQNHQTVWKGFVRHWLKIERDVISCARFFTYLNWCGAYKPCVNVVQSFHMWFWIHQPHSASSLFPCCLDYRLAVVLAVCLVPLALICS